MTLEQMELENHRLEALQGLAESLRRERITLSETMAAAYRCLGSQCGQLSDAERASLCATIKECRDQLAQIDAKQSPAYRPSGSKSDWQHLVPCPIKERAR
jgi:hypothetical protein